MLIYIENLAAPARFLRALDSTLAVSGRFAADDFAALLRQATRAAHPIGYLDDIRWLAGLQARARDALVPLIARRNALDLTWLRGARLAIRDVELLALAPDTNWALLQRRALLAEGLPMEVQVVVGTRIDALKKAPPGTEFWTPEKGRKRQLRWSAGHGTERPSLTIDSKGRIVVGGADDLSRAALSRNMRKQEAKLQGHQDHHIVPIAVARDHEVFRLARTKGSWDPNHPDNGIQLPASKQARDVPAWPRTGCRFTIPATLSIRQLSRGIWRMTLVELSQSRAWHAGSSSGRNSDPRRRIPGRARRATCS